MRKTLVALLAFLLRLVNPQIKSVHFQVVGFDGTIHEVKHMQTNITESRKFLLSAICASLAGNVATPTAPPTWTSSDTTIATVTPAADGMSAEVASVGLVGAATITATVDGITATDDITVTAGPVATVTLVASDPVAPV